MNLNVLKVDAEPESAGHQGFGSGQQQLDCPYSPGCQAGYEVVNSARLRGILMKHDVSQSQRRCRRLG